MNRRQFIAGSGASVLAFTAGCTIIDGNGGTDPAEYETPEEVVEAFVEARTNADIETMNALVHPDEPMEYDEDTRETLEQFDIVVEEIELVSEADDKVQFEVTVTQEFVGEPEEDPGWPEEDTNPYTVVPDDDGNWRLWFSN